MSVTSTLAATATVVLAGMCGIAAANLVSARRLRRSDAPRRAPRVSLLVPARNEEERLACTLPRLLASDYPALEILVLDDDSTDGTAALVERAAAAHPRLRLLRGTPPPQGWLGKTWACARLAEEAEGEILLFCDSDVEVESWAVTATVAAMERAGTGVLTALPRQETRGCVEPAIVPLVTQLPILALLPLRLVERVRAPSLCAANGQWLAFRRAAYRAAGGHAAVADRVLEDVELARAAKRAGCRLTVALAPDALRVRMYRDAKALREGFRKNLYPLIGGSLPALVATLVVGAGTMLFPLAAPLLGGSGAVAPLALVALLRVLGVAALGHDARSLPLHPLGAAGALLLAVDSAVATCTGRATWKGRIVMPHSPNGRTGV